MTDIEMLESVYNCLAYAVRCDDCPFYEVSNYCMRERNDWLKEYIAKLKRSEDDLK